MHTRRRTSKFFPTRAKAAARLHQESQQDIDEWRSGEPDHLSRSDAIRTLLWMGLAAAYDERKRNGRKDG
jgi:hypothetical protein